MKLRIKSNSVRLRLTQAEVDLFGQNRSYGNTMMIGPGVSLSYRIVRSDQAQMSLLFHNNQLDVLIPSGIAKDWVQTSLVGIEGKHDNGSDEPTSILVEKDFKCLIPRPDEDESGNYPNPLSSESHM